MLEKTITLKKHEDKRIAAGHLWAFSNEIQDVRGNPQTGDIVELQNQAGRFLGIGFYNPQSLIAVRIISRLEEQVDFVFFRRRIEAALALRKKMYPTSDTFRLVYGEGDYLPGLVIDKYGDFVSIQTFSSGMDQRLPLICDVLESLFHLKGIVERNEATMRTYEGLPQKKGIIRGSLDAVTISEHGIEYGIDLLEGQKTGFFLDQRENRQAIRRYAKGGNVLDCFCNDGGFALNAAVGGASAVLGVDVSEPAIQRAKKNAAVNHLDQSVQFVAADAFEFLKETANSGRKFDVIVLDPPSFAKSRKTVKKAKRGYKEIHTLAFQVLAPGGILATASCSHHIFEETFIEIISQCASETGRQISQLEWHGAAPDHPVLPAMPETHYLKFGIFHAE